MNPLHVLLTSLGYVGSDGLVASGDSAARAQALVALEGEELARVRAELVEAAEEVVAGEVSAEDVALLALAADMAEEIDSEVASRRSVADRAREIIARMRGEEPTADEAAPDDDAPADDGPEAVAAAANRAPARARVPARNRPAPARVLGTSTGLVAAGNVGGVPAGAEFDDASDVGRAIIERAIAMGRTVGGDGEQISVAMRNYADDYPETRRLDESLSTDGLYERVMATVRPASRIDAVVAAGGLCAPVAVNYALVTYGNSKRPLRDSLPSFLATRGGLTFNDSPVLSDILVDQAGGAVDTITLAEDQAGPSKTRQIVTCGDPHTEYVQAITKQLQNGNLADRYNPERMRAFVRLMDTAHARHSEALLFAGIISRRTRHFTDTPAKFGAYRDFKRSVLGAVEEISDQIRDDDQAIRIVVPDYLPAMLATDLIAQQPGDGAFQWTEDRVVADLNAWDPRINFTFVYDGSNGRLLSTPANGGRSPGFDADVDWLVFPEGAVLFLDGGMIDLGVVRDSTLIASNQFVTFSESMEGLARLSSPVYHVTSSLCSGGDSQVATDIAVCSPQGS